MQEGVKIIGGYPKKGDLVSLVHLDLSSMQYNDHTTYSCIREEKGPALCSRTMYSEDSKMVTLQFSDRFDHFFFENEGSTKTFARYEIEVINEK
jgi:hypothetical protein